MALVHHELCFGCGRTNLFGVLLELERTGPDSLAGRCFIKQDHQGPEPGRAHEGVIAAALSDAIALACGPDARVTGIQVEFVAGAPVGAFLEIEAHARPPRAGASSEGRTVARASATVAQRD
jgi:acyl-coenzyme A thioesterase PaaI-like protein